MRSLLLVCIWASTAAAKPPRWQSLPLPPAMPAPVSKGAVDHDGAKIFYADYGTVDDARPPVILLHGGMGNSDHFAFQMPALTAFRVIVIDSRGQGRSSLPKAKLSYHQMATDVAAVMDALKLPRAAVAGWSDGGSIALDMAVTMPERVAKLFVLGTNYDNSGSKPRRKTKPSQAFNAYTAKCRRDHARFGNSASTWQAQITALLPVWRNPSGFTKDQLRSIKAPALIALGDHDEIITQAHVEEMGSLIPGARVKIFADTSHFALWQDPDSVNQALVEFLSG